ncbi:protein phosphatase 2C domain-containing protein [Tsukamurella pseudospumae]|nr:protein phosphatase 2C domain-containing protein [Tsukamurella pseudospumae]
MSDTGLVRKTNQDRFTGNSTTGVFVVADGVAGAPAGEVAAQQVVDVLPGRLESLDEPIDGTRVASALALLSGEVSAAGQGTDRQGMGSTAVAMIVTDRDAVVAHLGDSRAYLYRDGHVSQITRDHTYAEDLIASGDVSRERAERVHGLKGVSRFVGMSGDAVPDVTRVQFTAGDRMLVCTDGLTNMLDPVQIDSVLAAAGTAEEACRKLVGEALRAGGGDNVTVLVVDRIVPAIAAVDRLRAGVRSPAVMPTALAVAFVVAAAGGVALGRAARRAYRRGHHAAGPIDGRGER